MRKPAARGAHAKPALAVTAAVILMIIITITAATAGVASAQQKQQINLTGAGATFPFPLIDTWRVEYQKLKPHVNINYQSIGSGGGIKQFTALTVDFGASDAPLSQAQRDALPAPAVHIPETIGSVVAAYNVPGINQKGLKLSGPVLADIFLGKITRWDDPRIKSLNPDLPLPSHDIVVVRRSDGSGTTFVWTDYLSKVSPEWEAVAGRGKSVQWPTGVGSPGNEGVANSIKGTPYTVGYLELSYALTTGMPYAYLQNPAGNFIEPTKDSIRAAISSYAGSLPAGDESWEHVSTTNAPGEQSYPIASFSYLLLYKELGTNPAMTGEKASELVSFVLWAVTDGQAYSGGLSYVPLPDEVVALNKEALSSLTFGGQPVLAPPGQGPAGGGEGGEGGIGAWQLVAALAAVPAALISYYYYLYRRRRGSRAQLAFQEGAAGDSSSARGRRRIDIAGMLKKPRGDRSFRFVVVAAAGYTAFLIALVAFTIASGSSQVFAKEGLGFLTGTDWNAVEGRESYGALPYIVGTLVSSGIAMAIGVPISIGIAVFVTEIAQQRIATPLSFVVELLAAVPSIIYGLWALFVFRFWVRDLIEVPLNNAFGGSLPLFAQTPFGLDVFTAGIVLAIMIIPTVSSVSREVIRAVPNAQREAAYSLGATRFEMVKMAVFPYAKSGLFGAAVLGLGRAVGETMLVTMIIGNAIGAAAIPDSLFAPSQTLASLIANEFNEAVTPLHTSALIGLGVVLFMLTIGINIAARLMVARMAAGAAAGPSATSGIARVRD
ncbi:phosphate ABC transporter substrate-binding protein PstS [Nitrososphaera sp.]|uniref:phosphate ABC transporter substrate-binding protein PstS n=1 Tax=Nitrososphaera sp. TaxID=1971748 RepID=UPI00307D33A5